MAATGNGTVTHRKELLRFMLNNGVILNTMFM